MASLLDFLPLLSLDFERLTFDEFNAVIDDHGADLPGLIDAAYFNGSPGDVIAAASDEIGNRLGERLFPIADALVAAATKRTIEDIRTLGALVRGGTAIAIVSELFPADDVVASLRSAVNHVTIRIGLQARATTHLSTQQ